MESGPLDPNVGAGSAEHLDALVHDRDRAAADRDAAADDRDSAASDRDATAAHRSRAGAARATALIDRAAAAGDRFTAEQDRLFAALDRDFAEFDRRESARERGLIGDTGFRAGARRADVATSPPASATMLRGAVTDSRPRGLRRLSSATRPPIGRTVRPTSRTRSRSCVTAPQPSVIGPRLRVTWPRPIATCSALERERRARDLEAGGGSAPVLLLVAEAETDRQLATLDRLQSAMDRLAAVQDRMDTPQGPASPGRDTETGVLMTGEGLWLLERELLAADEDSRSVAAVLIDVSDQVTSGRPLPRVVDEVRRCLSHRDLVVRWSSTQFLVVLLEEDASSAARLGAVTGTVVLPVERPGEQSLEEFLAAVTEAHGTDSS